MNRLVSICIACALVGCSTTTVHFHANSLTEEERETIRAGLEKRGLAVRMRDNEPPKEGVTVLYYPHDGIESDLAAIDSVLGASGFTATHSYEVHTEKLGKHEYTAGNIGLYVAPVGREPPTADADRVRAVFPMTMTDYEFVSTDCEREYVYEFFDNGTLAVNDFSLAVGEARIASLDWKTASDETVIISQGGDRFEYRKAETHREHSSEHSHYVVTYNITLEPTGYYRVPFGCKYKSTFSEGY